MRRLLGRALLCGSLALWAAGARAAQPDGTLVVTMLGDSLTAGYGLRAKDAIPARLQAALQASGLKAVVRAAGVSGDTSADGLARVGFSVRPDTDLCLVELGGNDLLQGDDAAQTRANLTAILAKLKARHIKAALIGLHAPDQIGAAYAHDFNSAFTAAAEAGHAPLYPSLLGDVGGHPALVQGDRIHPNAAGVKVIVAKLAPFVAKLLK